MCTSIILSTDRSIWGVHLAAQYEFNGYKKYSNTSICSSIFVQLKRYLDDQLVLTKYRVAHKYLTLFEQLVQGC